LEARHVRFRWLWPTFRLSWPDDNADGEDGRRDHQKNDSVFTIDSRAQHF
jgi:hypothetical protein